MKFGCTGNIEKPEFNDIFMDLYSYLNKAGYQIYLSEDVYLDDLKGKLKNIECKPMDYITNECDVLLSIGGDGTILSTFRQVADKSIPILGIHIGGLGFLSETNQDNYIQSLSSIVAGNYVTEKRMTLQVKIRGGDEMDYIALNDVVIDHGNSPRTLQLHTFVSDHYLNTYVSDGIIFCTPTGSTAYSLSAGGPIITPNIDVISVTPVCPHSLSARPIILSAEEKIKVQFNEDDVGMALSVDGQIHFPLDFTQEVHISRYEYDALLVRFPSNDYYTTLRTKMGWSGNFR